MTRLPIINRSCGDCRCCCVSLEVKELSKPAHTACSHHTGHGCGIYSERPDVCRGFNCSWLLGHYGLSGANRPDRLGLIVWNTDEKIIHVTEVWRGALNQPAARLVLRELEASAERGNAWVLPHPVPEGV